LFNNSLTKLFFDIGELGGGMRSTECHSSYVLSSTW